MDPMSNISRRNLLVGAAALSVGAASSESKAQYGSPKLAKRPKKLGEGSRIAIVAPASLADPATDLDEAVTNLKNQGFKPVLAPHAGSRWGYLAGTDEERAKDFNWAIENDDIDGVIFLQGGYGCTRMLHLLDYKLFSRKPKVCCGYSDITAICNALTRKSGVVTFHGPIALAKFDGVEGEWFKKVVRTVEPGGDLTHPSAPTTRQPAPGATTILPGKCQGHLVGGNLTLVSSMVGTPYAPNFKGAILFLEDINEAPYRVDRMLTQLWSSGALNQVAGIYFGDFKEKAPLPTDKPINPQVEFTMSQVLENVKLWVKCPVLTGGNFGHLHDKWTLPIGLQAELDATKGVLTLTHAAVTE